MQELSSHAETRVEQLEGVEQERASAAAEMARQLASVAERERGLKREQAAFDARQQEAESRVASREHTVRERDEAAGRRERAARDSEAEITRERNLLAARLQSLDAKEASFAEIERELDERKAALALELEEHARGVAEREVALQAWDDRLRSQSGLMERESRESGQASQEAFALLSELETREANLSRREAELLDAQTRLQAASSDSGADELATRRRVKDLDEREAALVAKEAEINRRLASAAREERDNDLVARLRDELKKREEDVASREQFFAERRERIESRETLLARREEEIVARAEGNEKLEDELRLRFARSDADLDLREHKLEQRLGRDRRARGAPRHARAGPGRLRGHGAAAVHGRVGRLLCLRLADVAELVDAHGSGPCARKGVEVQVLSSALLRLVIPILAAAAAAVVLSGDGLARPAPAVRSRSS